MICLGPSCKKSAGRGVFCSKGCEAAYVTESSQPANIESVTPVSVVTESKPSTLQVERVTRGGVRVGAGRPRVHAGNAARQAAYRGRRGSR